MEKLAARPKLAGMKVVAIAIVLALAGVGGLALAESNRERSRAQAVLIARAAASEDTRVLRDRQPDCRAACGTSGTPSPDSLAIMRVVEVHAEVRGLSFEAAVRELAPHATGTRPPTRPRQRWTSTLPATGKAQPAGWVTERDGPWPAFAENWVSFREQVVEAWLGGELGVFVQMRPVTWGTEEDYERFREVRGLCRLPCQGCSNVLAGKRGDPMCLPEPPARAAPVSGAVPAKVASGRP